MGIQITDAYTLGQRDTIAWILTEMKGHGQQMPWLANEYLRVYGGHDVLNFHLIKLAA